MDTSTKSAPRSKEFDDVYFSAQDGLAETRHVFLDSNNLPKRFEGQKHFVICETGFGTGLNFLAVWKLFEAVKKTGQNLHYITFEKFPLTAAQIGEYLQPWRDEFPDKLDALVKSYPDDLSGTARIEFSDGIIITLVFDDVNTKIINMRERVDCWFLDGFKPSSNPEMWSDIVFSNMARLSNKGATFATFTAAGFVKRGLRDAGFAVEKIRGFGRKRDMLCGYYASEEKKL